VRGALVDDRPVRPRARRRDHEVVAAEVERLDRVRIERQERAECGGGRPQALEERRVDVAVREAAIGPALVVDGGEDVGAGPGVADGREDALGSPEIEQEVVNQGNASASRD
jgi:hypothetical protein